MVLSEKLLQQLFSEKKIILLQILGKKWIQIGRIDLWSYVTLITVIKILGTQNIF